VFPIFAGSASGFQFRNSVIPIFHLAFHVKALDGIAIQVAIVFAFRNNDVLEAPNIIVGFPCVAQISRPSRNAWRSQDLRGPE